MKILVTEDSASMRGLIANVIRDMGHEALEADSGEQALSLFLKQEVAPDIAILDVELVDIDGFETAYKLKGLVDTLHFPIIFLTGSQKKNIIRKCLSVGDDYIKKPFQVENLIARIDAHLRVSKNYKQLESLHRELKHYRNAVAREHDIVKNIFTNHISKNITKADNLQYHISSVSVFNGDVLLAETGPTGNLYVLIGDVTGHGLPAAVGAIPVFSNFQTMVKKGLSIGTIAAEINSSLRRLLPDHMMMAATLIELNSSATSLNIWAGGMPALLIEDGKGNIRKTVSSMHYPLSTMEPEEFKQDIDIYEVQEGERVYLFTDGLEEARNKSEQMFTEERLHNLFNGKTKNMFDHIIYELEQFTKGSEQDDDITLVEITCKPNDVLEEPEQEKSDVIPVPWKIELHLTEEHFRDTDPIPQIILLLGKVSGIDVHQDYLSTILSELYSNALEHGLLQLDSAIKDTDDGFIEYYMQRSEKLSQLKDASIDIMIDYQPTNTSRDVSITITDSGTGFDFEGVNDKDDSNAFGRGIDIIRTLCKSVEYSNGGRTVTAIYSTEKKPV